MIRWREKNMARRRSKLLFSSYFPPFYSFSLKKPELNPYNINHHNGSRLKDKRDRVINRPHPKKQSHRVPHRPIESQTCQTPHSPFRTLQRRQNRLRLLSESLRQRPSLHDRLPLSRKIYSFIQRHRHRFTFSSLRVHHPHLHPRSHSLQRRQNPTFGSPRDHLGRSLRQRQRTTSYSSCQKQRYGPHGLVSF